MSNEPKAGMSIDPELLAAYIDRRLSPEQRAAVEAQLAEDPDAYALLVATLNAQDALSVSEQTGSRPRRWRLVGGVLAAAAAIALLAWTMPAILGGLRGDRIDPAFERLVAAVGPQRYVEARLSGGFAYGPLRTITRGSSASNGSMQNLELVAAAGFLQKAVTASPTPAALHAWGVAQLLLADYDGAIRTLREASTQLSTDASIQSDLAGALMARSRVSGRPEDLAPALSAADRALQLDANNPGAAFNRALALESLQLDEQAVQAWQRYLQIDSTTGWAAEARSRIEAINAKPRASAWSPGDPITLQNAFRARDWLHTTALPEWAASVASGVSSIPLRDRVVDTSAALGRVTSDRAFDAIAADVSATDPVRLKRVATGYAALAAAANAVRSDQLAQIGQYSRTACVALAAAGSDFTPACDVELASARMQERDFTKFRSELERLRPIVKARGLRYAEGRVGWLDGMATMLTGRLLDAVVPYAAAREIFSQIGEWPYAARMFSQQSEAEYWSGRYQTSWQSRHRGLQLASQVRDPYVSYSILSSVSAVLLNDRLPGPASTFAEASTRPWGVELPPLMTLFPMQRALMAAVEAGDMERASRARDSLDRIVQGSTDPRLAAMLGDVKVASATLDLAQGHRDAAERSLTDAIETMGPERDLTGRLWAFLGRAELYLQVGDTSRATQDLIRVVDRLTARTGAAVNVRVADAGRVRRVAAKVALAAGDSDPQLVHLYDRARSVLDVRAVSTDPDFVADQLPENSAVIATVDDGDRLGCWVLTRTHQSFHRLPANVDDVRRLSSRLAFLASQGSAGTPPWQDAMRSLYNALLEPVAADLNGIVRVIVVPDGVWRGVPMQALLDAQGQPAAAHWSFVQAPSIAAALSEASTRPALPSVLIVADPIAPDVIPLPGARREAALLARVYESPTPAIVLIGKDATRSKIQPLLANASTIHFAVHAVSDVVNPGQAFLQLAPDEQRQDGRWRVDDLRPGSFDRSQTVILAACRSSEGDPDPSESVSSLAAAIMRAGAGTVIASLWPLDDASSAPLFEEIHRGLKGGESAEDALRSVALTFTKTHPEPMAVAAVSGLQVFRTGLLPRRSHRGQSEGEAR